MNKFLDPNNQYEIAHAVGPRARANAPKALTVPSKRPFCDLFPYFEMAEVRHGITEAAAKANGIRPKYSM